MTDPTLWVSAVQEGCFYALIALAYYVVLIGTGFFNFAVGEYAMVGGLFTAWMVTNHSVALWITVPLSILVCVALAAATEFVVVRPVQRRSGLSELPALVAVVAVLFTIQQLGGVLFGYITLPGATLLDISPIKLGSASLNGTALLTYIVTGVLFVASAVWIRTSRTGRMLRAVGDNRSAAALLGLPVARVRVVAFALCGLVAAVAGILFAPQAGIGNTNGVDFALDGFLALVVGGTGSTWAPLAGGMILGGVEIFVPFYFGGPWLAYVLLIVALVFFGLRPEGIFARRVRV
ncbi:MAG TPA: branched-chain amino acid ABC transporter permease [Acidimicrobiales bacterium]|nr:branched-chain amino acid ABC transporter permease [Acidimicrobiales bacterium]